MKARFELPVTSISVSSSGDSIVLAAYNNQFAILQLFYIPFSKKGLYIVDSQDIHAPARFIKHASKWEVTDVAWVNHRLFFLLIY